MGSTRVTDGFQNIEEFFSPRILVYPEQVGAISDAAKRSFVIGIERIEGEFVFAHKPVVQRIEEGTLVRLKARSENDKIRLDGDIAVSQVGSVGVFDYPQNTKGKRLLKQQPGNLTVQVPEQTLKKIHFSMDVESGEAILLDPVYQVVKNKDDQQETRRLVFLVKPTLVNLEGSSK
ncbi:MAG: hypothetical protein AAF939_09310 [Planctomycetota bacterium]